MKAQTDLVLTRDRSRAVSLEHPEADPTAWVASKGEDVPDSVNVDQAKSSSETKKRTPSDNKAVKPEENK